MNSKHKKCIEENGNHLIAPFLTHLNAFIELNLL